MVRSFGGRYLWTPDRLNEGPFYGALLGALEILLAPDIGGPDLDILLDLDLLTSSTAKSVAAYQLRGPSVARWDFHDDACASLWP